MGQKTVGILGGKGPEATVRLFQKIVEKTPAKAEEEHLRIIVDNHPATPKPSRGITGHGKSPLPGLKESAALLENAGADFIAMPCNSAHWYLGELSHCVSIPFLSIIEKTVGVVAREKIRRVGVLGSTGLVQSELYQKALKKRGISAKVPEKRDQESLMKAILSYKDLGELDALTDCLRILCEKMSAAGVGGLVLGCTELSAGFEGIKTQAKTFDTLDILAGAVVRECLE